MTLLQKNRYEINNKMTQKFAKVLFVEKQKKGSGLFFFLKRTEESILTKDPYGTDKALENRHVFRCGQECLSSVLISE